MTASSPAAPDARVDARYQSELAARGGDDVARRLVGGWYADVTYDEWRVLAAELAQTRQALETAVTTIEGLAEQQAMPDDWYLAPLAAARAVLAGEEST